MTMPGEYVSNKKSKDEEEDDKVLVDMEDHSCPICMDLLIEPVTLPCEHELCLSCFQQNVQESLCCPMCRCRISSWVRRQARLNNLVDQERWKQIKTLFPRKVRSRLEGYELEDAEEDEAFHPPAPRISKPGEIREEYERALQRVSEERDAERRREEEASAALLRTLLKEDERLKEETERLESQLKKDEELARLLETAGTPALRRKEEEAAKSENPNIQVLLLSNLHENESADPSNNNSPPSTPPGASASSDTQNNSNKRKASPVSPNQSKQPRLVAVSPRHPLRKSSDAPVRSPSPISGNRISKKKQKSKLSTVDPFEKFKTFKLVGQSSPNGVSAVAPNTNTDSSSTPTFKESPSLSESAIHKDLTNIIAPGSSNKVGGRKILFEKKLNKCDSKSGGASNKSRSKGSHKSSPSACNGTKLDMYFKLREKSVCEPYVADESSLSSEEKDRLFALALQKQYDMELKMSREVNRAKGTSDEYKLRQKSVSGEEDEEVTDKYKKKLRDKSQKKINT